MIKLAAAFAALLLAASSAQAQDMSADREKLKSAAQARNGAHEALERDRKAGNTQALAADRQKLEQSRGAFKEIKIQTGLDRAAVKAELKPMREKLHEDRALLKQDHAKLEADRASGNREAVRADREKMRSDHRSAREDREKLHTARLAHGLGEGRVRKVR